MHDFRTPIWMALKYLKRFRERVSEPSKIGKITEKNICLSARDSCHYGEVGTVSNISDKCEMMAILEYIVLERNKEISIERKLKI